MFGLPPRLQLGVTAGEETTTHSLRPSSSRSRIPTTGSAIPYHCLRCSALPILTVTFRSPTSAYPTSASPRRRVLGTGGRAPAPVLGRVTSKCQVVECDWSACPTLPATMPWSDSPVFHRERVTSGRCGRENNGVTREELVMEQWHCVPGSEGGFGNSWTCVQCFDCSETE